MLVSAGLLHSEFTTCPFLPSKSDLQISDLEFRATTLAPEGTLSKMTTGGPHDHAPEYCASTRGGL